MRTKLHAVLCCFAVILMLFRLVPIRADGYAYTVGEVQSLIDGIVAYKLQTTGSGSVQDWISGEIASGAGASSDWYAMALSQDGDYDFSGYRAALESAVAAGGSASATTREKNALALCACGSTDPYIENCLDSSIGQQGVMSWIYGLHVLNNGYHCAYDVDSVVDTLLTLQYPDGGWALFGDYGDIDVTAMTLQALAPQYPYRGDVQAAVNRGVDFLSERQQEDGGYKSFGTPNPESAAQVLTALSALGINCETDARFIKGDQTLIDGIVKYRLPDGSFSHLEGDAANETATVQALYSFIAYKRMMNGQPPLLVFDHKQTAALPAETAAPAQTAPANPGKQETAVSGEHPVTGTSTAVTAVTAISTGISTQITTTTTVTNSAVTSGTTVPATTFTTVTTTTDRKEMHLTQETLQNPPSPHSGIGYKPIASAVILGIGGIACLALVVLHRRNYKNFLLIGILTAAGIAVIWLTDIRSAEDYYSGAAVHKEHPIGTVTLEIRCDTVVGKSDADYIPADGTILAPTVFEIEEGDTAFDILMEAAQTYGIQAENSGGSGNAHGMVYISGIGYLYEFDFGDLSGWVYHVNGITPSRGCGEYVLSDGDRIEWLYTCELGRDLDEVYEP